MGNCCKYFSNLIHEFINKYQSICDNHQSHHYTSYQLNDQNITYQNQIIYDKHDDSSILSNDREVLMQNSIIFPEQFGKLYEIANLVGIGTTAKVYKVYSKINKMPLACKVIDKYTITTGMDVVDIKLLIDQLRKEVDILKRINHENIVTFYDFMETKDKLLIITEHLDGGELFEYILNNGPLHEDIACQLLYGVFSAISYLHDRGVIHRDIKPENLIFFRNQVGEISLKLIDFGFSTILKHDLTGSFMGTGGYIAPEIRQNKNYSMSVDSWSLGILLYVTLSGKLPFTISMESLPNKNNQCKEVFDLQFPIKQWSNISDSCKLLIKMLLEIDSMKRITVKEALRHPWFEKQVNNSSPTSLSSNDQHAHIDNKNIISSNHNHPNELPTLQSNLRPSKSTFQLECKYHNYDINNNYMKSSKNSYENSNKILFPDLSLDLVVNKNSYIRNNSYSTTNTSTSFDNSNNINNVTYINSSMNNINDNNNIIGNNNNSSDCSPTYINILQWEDSYNKSAGDLFYTTYVKQLQSPKKNKFNH